MSISRKEYDKRFDQIFGKRKKRKALAIIEQPKSEEVNEGQVCNKDNE